MGGTLGYVRLKYALGVPLGSLPGGFSHAVMMSRPIAGGQSAQPPNLCTALTQRRRMD